MTGATSELGEGTEELGGLQRALQIRAEEGVVQVGGVLGEERSSGSSVGK
jgi:hypothetical protein